MTRKFDVLIVGAGPAGCTCVIQLAKALPQLRIRFNRKGKFSKRQNMWRCEPYVVNQIKMLSPELAVKLRENGNAVFIKGLKIVGEMEMYFLIFLRGKKAWKCMFLQG